MASSRGREATALLLAAVLVAACGGGTVDLREARLAVPDALGGEAAGHARADEPRSFRFPQDHGPHPDFRNEWWYFTGNLDTPDGRHFGYQLTFFRAALAPDAPARASAWSTRQLYMAHFAVADVGGNRFHAHDRFARGALELAGVEARPFRIWLEDWSAVHSAPSTSSRSTGPAEVEVEGDSGPDVRRAATASLLPLRLRAASGEVGLDLTLERDKPLVLQGQDGLSPKSGSPGNASYYYSVTRMTASGDVTVGDDVYPVNGLSWLDREWSTSVLEEGHVGWDWFSLQLGDGRDLMLYLLRWEDGRVDPFSAGTLVEPDGRSRRLTRGDFAVEVLAHWESPRGGRYPSRWRLRVPGAGLDLDVEPWMADQELDVAFRYWEGAVRAAGQSRGLPVSGNGYVELTGYGDESG